MSIATAHTPAKLGRLLRRRSFVPRSPFAEICPDTSWRTYLPWSNSLNLRLRRQRSDRSNPEKPAYRQTHLVMPSYSRLRNAKFGRDNFQFLFSRDLRMPFMFTFREVYALAFDRVDNDHRRLIGISRRLRVFQGRYNLREVVPVNLEATPAKFFEYASQIYPRPRVTAVASMLFIDCQHPTELLQAIPVQNSGQISEFVSRRDVQSLPNHPFLQFAIPKHDKGMKLLTSHPGTQSEAQADRQPLPKRTR